MIVSRFQGNQRDGHGNHQAAGLITQEAFKAAADPKMFPEQIAAGLRPWQALKLYMGGVRENEDWTIRVDTGDVRPGARRLVSDVARLGSELPAIAEQRPLQRAARAVRVVLQAPAVSVVEAPAKETSFFDGIDTTIPGDVSRAAEAGAGRRRRAAGGDRSRESRRRKRVHDDRSVRGGAGAGARTGGDARALRALGAPMPTSAYMLRREGTRRSQDAIARVAGHRVHGGRAARRDAEPTGPFAAGAAGTMPPVVPGQAFEVRTRLHESQRGGGHVAGDRARRHASGWAVERGRGAGAAAPNEPMRHVHASRCRRTPRSRGRISRDRRSRKRATPSPIRRSYTARVRGRRSSALARYEVERRAG